MKIRSYLKVFLINVSIIIACFVVIELIFGNWLSERNLSRVLVPRNKKLTFNISTIYQHSKGTVTYSRDSVGLRGNYQDISNIDILTIGGSTTDQRYIDDEETWQQVLANEFLKDSDKAVSVVNAGVDGQTTLGHIYNFKYWLNQIPSLKTKYILLYVGLNDSHYSHVGARFDDVIVDPNHGAWNLVKSKSALLNLARIVTGIYWGHFVQNVGHGHTDFNKRLWTKEPKLKDHAQIVSQEIDQYKKRLRVLSGLIQNFSASPIFVTQHAHCYRKLANGEIEGVEEPFKINDGSGNGLDKYIIMKLFNAATIEVCQATRGAICLDLDAEVKFQDDEFYDYLHHNPRGARRIGEYLYSKLRNYF